MIKDLMKLLIDFKLQIIDFTLYYNSDLFK